METESQRLHQSALQIIFSCVRTVTPARLTIVWNNHLINLLFLLGPLLCQCEEQPILRRCKFEKSFWQLFRNHLLLTRSRINRHQITTLHACTCVIVTVRARHPLQTFGTFCQYTTRCIISYTTVVLHLTTFGRVTVTGDQILSIGRNSHSTETSAQQDIRHVIEMLAIFPESYNSILLGLGTYPDRIGFSCLRKVFDSNRMCRGLQGQLRSLHSLSIDKQFVMANAFDMQLGLRIGCILQRETDQMQCIAMLTTGQHLPLPSRSLLKHIQ